MFIIPLTGKLSRHNLPIITTIIILINIFVFFTIQSEDGNYYKQADEFYLSSGLADIELLYYPSSHENTRPGMRDSGINPDRKKLNVLIKMNHDRLFQKKLADNQIIRPGDPRFEQWRELRNTYESIQGKTAVRKYGFIPRAHEPITIISYMFLHSSLGHLLGNMVFLWLVGCVLELGLGRLNYIVLYLLGGVFSAGFFYLFHMSSMTPLVGASGAIAGLIGAYTVAFGRTKINVFYTLGFFYFNYTKVYAILLLPIWIANEAFHLYFDESSNVAYLAHIGGLLCGAVMGVVSVKLFKKEEQKVFDEDENPRMKIKALMEEALKSIETLDLTAARSKLTAILAVDPANDEALKHLYNIDKLHPQDPRFHQTAAKRLVSLGRQPGYDQVLTEAFIEYYRLAGKPQLNPEIMLNISGAFTRLDKMEEAEALIGHVYSTTPNHPRLSSALLEMAKMNDLQGRRENSDRYLKMLVKYFPQSPEAVRVRSGR